MTKKQLLHQVSSKRERWQQNYYGSFIMMIKRTSWDISFRARSCTKSELQMEIVICTRQNMFFVWKIFGWYANHWMSEPVQILSQFTFSCNSLVSTYMIRTLVQTMFQLILTVSRRKENLCFSHSRFQLLIKTF